MKALPNVLSLSRIPLGFGIFLAANSADWGLAFGLILVALATDVADGKIARRKSLESPIGADLLEPMADLVFTAGMLAGLYAAGFIGWEFLVPFAVIAGCAQLGIFVTREGGALKKFLNFYLPFQYVLLAAGLTVWYGLLALSDSALQYLAGPTVLLAGLAVWSNRRRITIWLSGRAH